MTAPTPDPVAMEKQLGLLVLMVVSISAVCLVTGLAWWVFDPANRYAAWLLRTGLFTLMTAPLLRVALSLTDSVRVKDWFLVATTVIVLAELTLTVVDAVRLR
jgi:uncharacterized protein DUF1634